MLVARGNGQVGKDDISTILALITGLVMTTIEFCHSLLETSTNQSSH